MSGYDASDAWDKALRPEIEGSDTYPAQGLIRLIRGRYPSRPPIPPSGLAIDIGCGDGRNAAFLADSGFAVLGIEIAQSIVDSLRIARAGCAFEVGLAHRLPISDSSYDLAVAWNSIYYMGQHRLPLEAHFREAARVLRPSGALIASLPMPSCFIFADSTDAPERPDPTPGVVYRTIRADPFGIRNGEVLATFESMDALRDMARLYFSESEVGTETGDWFGYGYNWWVLVAVK